MLLLDKVISLIAPHLCIVCRREGSVLCSDCLMTAGEPPAPRCVGCKQLMDDYKTCTSCRSWIDVYAVYVATAYEGVYEALLHEYKFRFKRQAVEPIVAVMAQVIPRTEVSEMFVVPVPSAPKRTRLRGFDHGVLLARCFTRRVNSTFTGKFICWPVLGRRSNTRQLGSSRAQRIRQVNDEFYVKNRFKVSGKSIILCDDVTTTGASLAAAAKVLKQAGAKRVYAVVYAQKV